MHSITSVQQFVFSARPNRQDLNLPWISEYGVQKFVSY